MMAGRWSTSHQVALDGQADRWNGSRRGNEGNEACKALWAAVVARAVDDLGSEHNATSAAEWVRENGGSFEWVCDQLGLETEAVRERLLGSDSSSLQRMRARLVSEKCRGGQERRTRAA